MKITWKVLVGLGVVTALVVSLFVLDDRYFKTAEAKEVQSQIKKDREHELLLAEAAAVKTFQGLQMQQMVDTSMLQLQFYNFQKKELEKSLKMYEYEVLVNPNSNFYKEQLRSTQESIKAIDKTIDSHVKSLSNIKVGSP